MNLGHLSSIKMNYWNLVLGLLLYDSASIQGGIIIIYYIIAKKQKGQIIGTVKCSQLSGFKIIEQVNDVTLEVLKYSLKNIAKFES